MTPRQLKTDEKRESNSSLFPSRYPADRLAYFSSDRLDPSRLAGWLILSGRLAGCLAGWPAGSGRFKSPFLTPCHEYKAYLRAYYMIIYIPSPKNLLQ